MRTAKPKKAWGLKYKGRVLSEVYDDKIKAQIIQEAWRIKGVKVIRIEIREIPQKESR